MNNKAKRRPGAEPPHRIRGPVWKPAARRRAERISPPDRSQGACAAKSVAVTTDIRGRTDRSNETDIRFQRDDGVPIWRFRDGCVSRALRTVASGWPRWQRDGRMSSNGWITELSKSAREGYVAYRCVRA